MRGGAIPDAGRFRVIRQIGEGGMGVVYEAVDLRTDAHVALKSLRSPTGELLGRLKREFRSLQDLQHPNLVTLGELIEESGVWFFTMELVDGVTFLEWVRPGIDRRSWATSVSTQVVASGPTVTSAPPPDADGIVPARRDTALDEDRLRDALGQLVRGLACLHEAGKIHRDVKPSNILVTDAGRVVLLDFGLVTETSEHDSSAHNIVGTVAYMAPEQGAGVAVGPEADWYSVGCVLYEALTDRLPFEGRPLDVLAEKAERQPVPPRALSPLVPKDLSDLCMELLRPEPSRRPTAPALLGAFGGGRAAHHQSATSRVFATTFVGRRGELATLHRAYERSRAGGPAAVYVSGESGVGKSALLRRFTNSLRADDPTLVVLLGRCYERESVPYKAVDSVIDALARYLARLPRVEASTLVPPKAWLLLQAFPILRTVDVIASSPKVEVPDPQELRTRMFGAVRQLFALLAERRPVVIVIDDMQWADADSMALLAELVRPPDAPSILLLCSWRAGDDESGLRERLFGLPVTIEEVALGRLADAEARELAGELLRRVGAGDARADGGAGQIAREADGHPLFIDELVRHTLAEGGASAATVDDLLTTRIASLEAPARRLMSLVALAGAPLRQDVAGRAAGMRRDEVARWTARLRVGNLVRTGGIRDTDTVEPYHERVTVCVLRHVDDATARALHADIARAMEACDVDDAEAMAVHLEAAGDRAGAAAYAEQAARAADRALAFDRAAGLYRLAAGLVEPGRPEARALTVRLGDALANAGRGADAGAAYLEAAAGATAAEALDLQRRAAQEFIIAGHIDRGLDTMRAVLAREGLSFPRTPRRALARVVWSRLWLRLRGLAFTRRDLSEISERELVRIDLCWHVGLGLGTVDTVRGIVFHLAGLERALRAGEPYRLARALGLEAAFLAIADDARSRRRLVEVMARCEALAADVHHPHIDALIAGARAHVAMFSGRFAETIATCAEAEQLLRERCVGVARELAAMRLWRLRALIYCGRLREVSHQLPGILQEYKDRGDLFGSTSLRAAVAPFVHLAADRAELALSEAEAAGRAWTTVGFHVQHYYVVMAEVAVALYRGDAEVAHRHIEEAWPKLVEAMITRVPFSRVLACDARGRAALAVAAVDEPRRARLLRLVEQMARSMLREGDSWSRPLAHLLQAGAAAQRGDSVAARGLLELAITGCEAWDLELHAAAARRRLGERIGGEPGRALVEDADAWMAGEGVAAPARLTDMLVPGPGPRGRLGP